jgi:hypothetical protein
VTEEERWSHPIAVGGFYPAVRTRGFLPFRRGDIRLYSVRETSRRDSPSGVVSIGRRIRVHVGLRSFTDGDHVMKRMRTRTAAVGAVLVVAFVVVSWLQPAAAHVGTPGHLWTHHLRPKADLRYLQNSKVYVSPEFTLGILANLSVTRLCPPGMQAIGGGVDFDSANADVQVISDAPIVSGTNLFGAAEGKNPAGGGWRVTMHNNGILAVNGVVGVICSR